VPVDCVYTPNRTIQGFVEHSLCSRKTGGQKGMESHNGQGRTPISARRPWCCIYRLRYFQAVCTYTKKWHTPAIFVFFYAQTRLWCIYIYGRFSLVPLPQHRYVKAGPRASLGPMVPWGPWAPWAPWDPWGLWAPWAPWALWAPWAPWGP